MCILHRLIPIPTHLLTKSSFCIDLIFTDQPNLIINSGFHLSLHPNCHHQITFCRYHVSVEYPPPYERLVWNYKKVNKESMKQALMQIN